jgi:two-component system sensor histidine kinase UhpB
MCRVPSPPKAISRAAAAGQRLVARPPVPESNGQRAPARDGTKPRAGPPRLARRLVALNAAVLVLAGAILALSPVTISSPVAVQEALLLVGGLAAMLVVDVVLTRRALRPLRRLTRLMDRADPLRPGERIPVDDEVAEVVELTTAFNAMLERLEDERRESARVALTTHEAERRHVAQELHDAVGQALTVVLLEIQDAARHLPPEHRPRLAAAQDTVRLGLEETRRIVAELRPEALDDLGLRSALTSLVTHLSERTGIPMRRHFEPSLPTLDPDVELVVYRVAQEALTNAVRHARPTEMHVHLERTETGIRLRVVDDGPGLSTEGRPGGGLRGMRERAVMVGAQLDVLTGPEGGVEIRLDVDAPV